MRNVSDPARLAAHAVLMAVLQNGAALDCALTRRLEQQHDSTSRRFAHRLVMTVLRRHGALKMLIRQLLDQPLPTNAQAVDLLLELGLAQLMCMDVPDHAAIDSTVSLTEPLKLRRYRSLTNAVLRRAQRERDALLPIVNDPQISVPDWLARRWRNRFGSITIKAIAAAHQKEPPLDISVAGNPARWAKKLDGKPLTGLTVRRQATAVASLEGYEEGHWWVQDAAAALPARLLLTQVGRADGPILDLCAAPGGKTAQLLNADYDVVAVERSARRLRRLNKNLRRLKRTATIIEADAVTWRANRFPAILVDAPCSATGTIRRRPDIPWTKSEASIRSLTAIQAAILHNAIAHLEPGGVLVYAVCSLEPEEGPYQIAQALSRHSDLMRLPIREDELDILADARTDVGDVQTLPSHLSSSGGVDGFFIARLTKLRRRINRK
ncbi:MAG: MFS transporter [Rhodospirillaceae bacterium]|nr:MFS transporter [Rhodospirillaceae bacterium]MCY4310643.1 MFS transporter [Rhodospirillaceae bacterium]